MPMTTTIGRHAVGASSIAGSFGRATPTVVATGPAGTVSAAPFNAAWTFSSTVGRTQAFYRVRILTQDGSTVLNDSGIVAGAGVTAAQDMILSSGSSYMVAISASDGFDWSDESTLVFLYDGNDLEDIAPLASVGQVYEVGINGQGYMLADHPDRELRYQRRVVPLDSQRLATGDTPFSEAIDRYALIGFTDWTDGAGQRFYKREASSDKAYYTSTGVNPFTAGELTLLPGTSLHHSSAYAFSKAVVAGNKLFVIDASGQLSAYDDPSDATPTTFSITGATTPLDLASDGTYWYYADGANIYRNTTAVDPATAWSTIDARVIEWCSDRLVVAYPSAGTTANVVEVVNYTTGVGVGGSQKWTFETDTDVRSITSGDGYVWWAAVRNDRSTIYGWQLGSTNSYVQALEMPAGQELQAISYYQGNVFVRCSELTATGESKAVIYRCATQTGLLTPTRVMSVSSTSTSHSLGDFAGDDRFVYFSYRGMNNYSGIGCIDLATGGWTKWLEAPANTGVVRSICQWYGRTVFTVDGYGAVVEKAPSGGNFNGVTTGTLTSSINDLNTGQRKSFNAVSATFDPLPAGATITLAYSLDAGNSFTSLSPAVSATGQKSASWQLEAESDSIMLRATLTHGTLLVPVLRSMLVRAHALGLADQVLILPINCSDVVSGLNNRPLPLGGVGTGSARTRTLEALAQTRVVVQDVDWRETDATYVYDVVDVDTRRVGVMNAHAGKQSNSYVTTVTLRRNIR